MEIYGAMIMTDQYGNKVEDKDIFDTCMQVYSMATELINSMMIPALNDILYGERKFPMEEKDQAVYEHHGDMMSNATYKYVAYCGTGKVPGKNLLAYPAETVSINLKEHIFSMKVIIEKL